jgi:hypothetical protein
MVLADAIVFAQYAGATFHIGIAAGCDIMFLALICGFCDVLLNVAILSPERKQDKFVFFLIGVLTLMLLTWRIW